MTAAESPLVERWERWGAGEAYESYVGRWSRQVAAEFVSWLGVPPGARWLDVGCGTGAVTATLLGLAEPREVIGIDPAPGFVAHAARALAGPRARFEVGDAQALPAADGTYDAVVSGLVLNFVPSPSTAVAEMSRATRPGGVVAFYVWDYAGQMQFMRHFWDAAAALDPAALELDEGRRFPWCRPEPIEGLLRQAGLQGVASRAIDVPTRFASFDDYWTPFLGGQGPAPGYAMSLGQEGRAALREWIRSRLPIAADGSIDLLARAWAVRGTR